MPVSPDMLVALLSPAPFVAAALAPALTRALGHRAAWLLALVPLSIFAALATFIAPVAGGAAQHFAVSWVPSLGLDFGITIDGLSLLFALTIAGIGALIIVYSGAYLKGDPAEGRFLATMLLFMGAMLGLVLSDGLVALYVFWEMTAVTSYLLIGHDRTRLAARRAALQALLITVAGGLCLLLAAVLIYAAADTWSLAELPGKAATLAGSGLFMPIVVLLFLAAFTKSAQFPFHFWLPNAMEAPTPVSAYLHSAAMVQAGVYLLARLSPVFSGQPVWAGVLTVVGGLTFLWGAVGGLRQADLKQMLAQSTISSLGLLVLLIGIGGEVGAAGAAAYFLTHALYKAGFFLVAGLIDHETGVRDITALGGLREKMALGFIAAILAGLSMLGLPPTLGYLAKEAIYAAPGPEPLAELLLPAVLVVGNAILGALALALVAKPFMGPLVPTPKAPQEGPPAMLLGPLLLGMAGIGAALLVPSTAGLLLAPAATAILGHTAELHMGFGLDLRDPAPWLSVATWLLSAVIFWRLALLRAITRRVEGTFPAMFDRLFDAALSGLLAFAAAGTRLAQNGHLASYLLMVLAATAAALLLPLLFLGGPALPAIAALTPLEWLSVGLAVIGLVTILLAPSLLFGIISLGVQGLAAALIYLEFEAPDVSLTQFMVEVLSVAILALVMTRLHLGRPVQRPVRVALRDGLVAVLCGAGTTAALMAVLDGPFDARLGAFFEANATALAHGHNIVNVILVDFRGLDTLGEISVLMTAAVATVALIATGRRLASRGNGNAGGQNRRRRSRRHKAAPVAAAGPPAPDGAGAAS